MSKQICVITGKETSHNFKGVPFDKEVLEFARKYRDAIPGKNKNLRGILIAFQTMKGTFGHTWESIKKKLIDELKDKNITF